MFRTRITFAQDAVLLDDEHVPFTSIDDASVEDGVLVLVTTAGTRRVKVKSSDAMMVLDGVLDGIERTHPRSPYRTPGTADAIPQPAATPAYRLRRRTASVGSPDLMIGRTFTGV